MLKRFGGIFDFNAEDYLKNFLDYPSKVLGFSLNIIQLVFTKKSFQNPSRASFENHPKIPEIS